MATAHIKAKEGEIKKKVLMPGDPLRAKYIAEKFLEDVTLVNDVRGMYAYTGTYKGKELTIFASGMGGASMGIYAYELYHFYQVEQIIRIGTCGSNDPSVKVRNMVIGKNAYTLSSFPKLFFNDDNKLFEGSAILTQRLVEQAKKQEVLTHVGNIITSDVFDVYVDREIYMKNYPKDLNALAAEMEAAILFSIANHLQKQAACILTVVDSIYDEEIVSSDERQKSLDNMIICALEAI